jgi:hypothetical protein
MSPSMRDAKAEFDGKDIPDMTAKKSGGEFNFF